MIGLDRRPANVAPLARKALVAALSLALIGSGIPTPALAFVAEGAPVVSTPIRETAPALVDGGGGAAEGAVKAAQGGADLNDSVVEDAAGGDVVQPSAPSGDATAPGQTPSTPEAEGAQAPVPGDPAPEEVPVTPEGDAGFGQDRDADDLAAEAADQEGEADPLADAAPTLTLNVRVTGLGAPAEDGSRMQEDWLPLTEVSIPTDVDVTAWDVFSALLDQAGYTYQVNEFGPTGITTPDGRMLDSSFIEPYRYWAFLVDGVYGQGDEGSAMTCKPRDGMTIELRYLDEGATELPLGGVTVNPDTETPFLDSEWNGFLNGGAGAVTQAPTPVERGEEAWAKPLLTPEEVAAEAGFSASDPIIIAGKIYIVTASIISDPVTFERTRSLARLQVVDRATGRVEREVTLGARMDDTCRPAYADGIIVIPLTGGYLQAVSAKTLETLWVSPAMTGGQAPCTLTIHDGYVYASMFDALNDDIAASGSVRRHNLRTGALAGVMDNKGAGYYWAGGVMVGEHFVIGDDAGTVHVFTSDLSREVSHMRISSLPIRSSLVHADGFVYAVTRGDGTLHKLRVADDGQVSEVGSVAFADTSTSTPTIVAGRAFVGGVAGKWPNRTGVLAVIDVATMKVRQVRDADGSPILDEVKSSPLVSVRDGETYVYFTSNGVAGPWPEFTTGGGVYVYRLGDDEASMLYQPGPGMVQYCMASICCDAEGNLYYTNDSGHLFKISGAGDVSGPGGETGDGSGDGSGNGGEQGGDGSGDGSGDGGQQGGPGAQGDRPDLDGPGDDPAPELPGDGESPAGQDTTRPQTQLHAGGAVPAGAKPIANGVVASVADATSEGVAGQSSAPHAPAGAVDLGAAGADPREAGGASGTRLALMTGGVGIVGLMVSAAWMAFARRREED